MSLFSKKLTLVFVGIVYNFFYSKEDNFFLIFINSCTYLSLFIVFAPRPPLHYNYFPFLPPPPPHFYYFPPPPPHFSFFSQDHNPISIFSSTTTTTTTFQLFSLTTTTESLLFSLHHHRQRHISINSQHHYKAIK